VSTLLFERAREVVLEYLDLDDKYVVVFCTPWRSEALKAQLKPETYHVVSSQEIGLPLGLRALAVERRALPKGVPVQTGGDAVELVARHYIAQGDAALGGRWLYVTRRSRIDGLCGSHGDRDPASR
jgi:hypothetical protein